MLAREHPEPYAVSVFQLSCVISSAAFYCCCVTLSYVILVCVVLEFCLTPRLLMQHIQSPQACYYEDERTKFKFSPNLPLREMPSQWEVAECPYLHEDVVEGEWKFKPGEWFQLVHSVEDPILQVPVGTFSGKYPIVRLNGDEGELGRRWFFMPVMVLEWKGETDDGAFVYIVRYLSGLERRCSVDPTKVGLQWRILSPFFEVGRVWVVYVTRPIVHC